MASIYDPLFDKLRPIFAVLGDLRAAARDYAPIDLTTGSGVNLIRDEYTPEEMTLIAAIADQDTDAMFIHPLMVKLRAAAERTIIEIVNDLADVRVTNINEALREVAATLADETESLNDSAVTVTPTARAGNTGNGTLAATMYGPMYISRGEALPAIQNSQVFPQEDWYVSCVADSVGGGLRAGNEAFAVYASKGYPWHDRRYPGGLGGVYSTSATSGLVDQSRLPGQNILRNGALETQTSNLPLAWTASAGSPGTSIVTTATAYDGVEATSFVGDGATNSGIRQKVGSSDGTNITLLPDTVYYACALTRSNADTITKTMTLSLADVSGTAIGVSGLQSATSSSHTTTYSRMSGFIQTPHVLPTSDVYVAMTQTGTALAIGENILFDALIIAPVWRPHPLAGGIVIPAGSTAYRVGDHFDVAWTNDYAGLNMFYLNMLFDLCGNGIAFPVDNAPTIPD